MRTDPGPATLRSFTSSGPVNVQFVKEASHSVASNSFPFARGGAKVSHIWRMFWRPKAAKSNVTRQTASDLPPENTAVRFGGLQSIVFCDRVHSEHVAINARPVCRDRSALRRRIAPAEGSARLRRSSLWR